MSVELGSQYEPRELVPEFTEGVVFSSDLDGVVFDAPFPFKTYLDLVTGKFHLSNPLEDEGVVASLGVSAVDRIRQPYVAANTYFHGKRPVKSDVAAGISNLGKIVEDFPGIRTIALTGREGRYKYEMTKNRLEEGTNSFFGEDIFTSPGVGSSRWKEWVALKMVEDGKFFIHVDDDLKAALRIARVSDYYPNSTHVYLINNKSNSPKLLKKAGIILPDNVERVANFNDAVLLFGQLVSNRGLARAI